MDLVKIGFLVKADGLKDANTQVDQLLTKVDKIGKGGKQAATEFDNSQKKVASTTKKVTKEVDATTKALEKQKLVGDYLGKGLDKTTANSIASFKQLGASTEQINQQLNQLGKNGALVQQQKQAAALTKEQEKHQEQVKKVLTQYEGFSSKSLGGGIIDSIDKQNKGLQDLNKEYASLEKASVKQLDNANKTVTAFDKISNKSLGGGILDQVDKQNKGLQELNSHYAALEKEQNKELKRQQASVDLHQQALSLEQSKSKYVAQGYGKTDAGRIAKFEASGATTAQVAAYAASIDSVNKAFTSLNPTMVKATESQSKFMQQVGGIAKYAVLSAVIYGAMTATMALTAATIKMADEYTSIQNRMKLYVTDAQELTKVNAKLAQFSIANNVGLRETATLFSRLQPAMQKIGANTAAVTSVVDSFGKSLRIGGATAMEAASATIQFSQAMASGKLAGDEFRSISEASPRFLKAIAEGSGIAAEKLKEMSAAGALTTEVISKALLKEYPKLIEENKKLGVTLEQGANALKTGFLVAFGEFNEGAGITNAIGESMANLAQNMLTAAQSARQFGADVKKWFKDNAETISTVVDAFQLLATIIAARYVTAIVLARIESMRYQATLAIMAAQQANVTRSSLLMSTAITAAGNAAKGALAFFGGWVGLALTVVGTVAAYALFNKESAKTVESLQQQGLSIDGVVDKYKEMTQAQQKAQLVSEADNVKNLTKAYEDQKTKLVSNILNMSRHNDMSGNSARTFSQLAMQYKAGNITLDQLTKTVQNSSKISQESKDKFILMAGGVSTAGLKAKEASELVKLLTDATIASGDAAFIAGGKFNKYLNDLRDNTKINKDAAVYMQKYGLSQAKAVDLAKQDVVLRKQGKYATMEYVKTLQAEQASEEKLSDITQARSKAEKDANKVKKDAEKDLKKFSKQILELNTYNELLRDGVDLEVARIASQKEYIAIYKGNLDMAKELAATQERIKQAESRIGYQKSLRDEEEAQERIVKLIKAGVDYETAKAAAQAMLTDNAEGLDASALSISNSMFAQLQSTSALASQQEMLNQYLKDGLSLEQATFNIMAARLAKLTGVDYTAEANAYELALKTLEAEKALSDSQQKINAAKREQNLLTETMASGYDRAAVAAVRLAASVVGLTPAQALLQLQTQDQLTLTNERIDSYAEMTSLLGNESDILRDIKATYSTISADEAKRLEQSRKALEIADEYAKKVKEQKDNPIGDFSKINFDVFGDFGNPFQEALSGLNAYVSGMKTLDDNIKTIQESMRQYRTEAEVATLNGETQRAKDLLDAANKQISVEKDLQKQKAETNDIAYGQGLKFAKAFFKEESKGYKIVNGLEMALQAKKIAYSLWEQKDTIATLALKLKSHVMDMLGFTSAATTKVAAQGAVNVAKGTEAVLSQGSGDPYTAFARMAAMIAVVAGLGVAISGGIGGGSSGSVTPANDGTGTVFGDSTAQSESIKNSIELLSENSDLMLPLTSAMLRSLRNIESSLGGVANLIIRGDVGNIAGGLTYDEKLTGVIGKAFGVFEKFTNKLEGFGLTNFGLGTSIVGKVLGGLFGKTSAEVTGSGLFGGAQSLGNVMDGGFNLSQYADVTTTKKSWFSKKTSSSTQYQAASQELTDQFGLIFTNVYDSILSASSVLGRDENGVIQKLRDSIINIGKIDTKGKTGEEIQEALESVIGQQSDLISKGAVGGLEDFQKVGEGYFETLMRVATGIETASYFTDRLNVTTIKYNDIINKQGDVAAEMVRQSVLLAEGNKNINGGFYDLINTFDGTAEEITDFVFTLRDLQDQLFMTGKSGEYLTSAMILGAGGLDTLSSGFDAYFEMLSPAEQAAELTRRLTNEFAIFGKQLPSDVEAFRNLVSSIDISSEAGQKLYGQIIALAPEFNDLQDSLKSANSDVNALVKSLRDLAEQARAARGETEQPRNLAYTRSQFEQASVLAMQGDIASAEKLLTLGKDLMGLSKTYSVSGSEYARDLALIQRAATVSADIQEQGLGTSISTTLTPSGGSTVTPTITTTSSSTDAKIEALKADLNAALLAIAKSSQKTSDRLEAWDYGDRMLVRVEQDGANDRIPVTTT